MKDGTVYKGKIQIDTDKAILIGNPPFDPTSYLLKTEDIDKIVYEEYRQPSPAERKRGFLVESRIQEQFYSSDSLSFSPATSLYLGLGFRVHPMLELNGGIDFAPGLHAKDAFSVSDGTTTRRYEEFWQYNAAFSARLYPFVHQKWKTEPYLTAGYHWSHLTPSGSGDHLKGSGWLAGLGLLYPMTRHFFLESRLTFQSMSYDTVEFLGREGSVSPTVDQTMVALSLGVSYRL